MSISDYYYDEINSEENLQELDNQEPSHPDTWGGLFGWKSDVVVNGKTWNKGFFRHPRSGALDNKAWKEFLKQHNLKESDYE